MKRILILVAISFLFCSTASAQGGGGESTKRKEDTKKSSGGTSVKTTPPKPTDSPVPTPAPAPDLIPPVSPNAELRFNMPEGWVTERPTSTMRVAQYNLPKAANDKEDASLVLYYFGQATGGSIEANVDRWINQMQQPDGTPSKTKARIDTINVNGLRVTTVDVSGTYIAQLTPDTAQRHDDNYRLRAAVVETPRGNYFLKLIGPEDTIALWDQAFKDYVKSFEFK